MKNINYSSVILYLLSLAISFTYFSFALPNILNGIAILIFIIAIIKKQLRLNLNKRDIIVYLLIITPFILTVISAFMSSNLEKGMEYVWMRIPIIILPFVILNLSKIKIKTVYNSIFIFILASILATFFTIFYEIAYYKSNHVFLNPDFTMLITPIQHPYFGVYTLISFILLVKIEIPKVLKITGLLVLLLGIVLSTSRLVYLLFLVFVIIEASKYLSSYKRLFFIFGIMVVTVLIINSNKRLRAKVYHTFDYKNSPRAWFWNNSYKVITHSENIYLGVGIGDYFEKKQDISQFKFSKRGIIGYEIHNQYIEFIVVNGILGFLFIFSTLILYFFCNKELSYLYFIIISFAFTESILNRQYGVELYAVFLPLILMRRKNG